jgi:hypothetical protein
MKLKPTLLFLGLCLAILAVAASPAYARSNTAFSAYHVEGPLGSDPYTCMTEDNGAVFNNCTYAVSLEFDLPIDNAGEKTITVLDFWGGTAADNTFSCYLYAYAGTGTFSTYGPVINFTGPSQTGSTSVNVASGSNMQLICWNVPIGGGLANLSWNQ